jgi:hypothetical protein
LQRRFVAGLIAVVLAGGIGAGGILYAHEVIYQGTVLAVEADKLHVRTVDPEAKTPTDRWFTVTADTRVRRGDRVVTYASAAIVKDERIVVVVNHEAEVENVATELRLAAR